jgi:hypothetical protein
MRALALVFLLAAAVPGEEPAKPTEADAKPKAEAVTAALKGKDEAAKKTAIVAAGTCAHPLCANALAPAFSDPSEDIRVEAAKALGKMKGLAEAAKVLNAAFAANPKPGKVLHAVTPAMGSVGHASSVPVLGAYLSKRVPEKDDEENIEVGDALTQLGEIRFKASVELLLDLLKKASSAGQQKKSFQLATEGNALRALNKLAGKHDLKTAADAQAWWKANEKLLNDDLTPKK